MTGRVHSIQSMGTLDGPGVRFVAFMQGCPLRCKCCHNPDTWAYDSGSEYTPEQMFSLALRYREYFGSDGGVTVSGGEPVMQPKFVYEFFRLCKNEGINTCLDTSGCVLNDSVKKLLTVTDRVLLDIKYTNNEQYLENVGCSIDKPLEFLAFISDLGIPTTLRTVIIPTINDTKEHIDGLKNLIRTHKNIDKTELLAFHKICDTKYESMGIPFPFGHIPEPTREKMQQLEDYLNKCIL